MSDLLIRGLDEKTMRRLKERAKQNGRSLQSEAKIAIEKAAGLSVAEALKMARQGRKELGKRFDDSTALVREDRER